MTVVMFLLGCLGAPFFLAAYAVYIIGYMMFSLVMYVGAWIVQQPFEALGYDGYSVCVWLTEKETRQRMDYATMLGRAREAKRLRLTHRLDWDEHPIFRG